MMGERQQLEFGVTKEAVRLAETAPRVELVGKLSEVVSIKQPQVADRVLKYG
jgi:hypothetical protein